MKIKFTQGKANEKGGIACLPLVSNIPKAKSKDWKKVTCPICGAECWESDLARQVIATGTMAACTMCVLKIGIKQGCTEEEDTNGSI